MKKKSALILAVSLLLMTMVVGTLAARTLHGVESFNIYGGTQLINHNNHAVRVNVAWGGFGNQQMRQIDINAGGRYFVSWEITLVGVMRR